MNHRATVARLRNRLALAALTVAALALVLAAPDAAGAQCAMCKSAVQAAGDQATRAMRSGILILLIPPVAIFCSIFAVFIKYKNGGEEKADTTQDDAR